MEFGGGFLNKRLNRGNDGGTVRRTTDIFQLATTVLFQNPIQNFALAPNNLTDAPALCLDFMKQVPTTWDETRFIDGYPGRYVVLARQCVVYSCCQCYGGTVEAEIIPSDVTCG